MAATAFRPVRPGVQTDGEWTIARINSGWQLYGCNVKAFDGPAAYHWALGPPWRYLSEAKQHAIYRSWPDHWGTA